MSKQSPQPESRDLVLSEKQTEAWNLLHDDHTTEIVFGGGGGGGKSRIGCAWIIEQCGLYPGSRWLIGRVELEQLKKTTLITFFEVASSPPFSMKAGRDFKYNSQEKTITFTKSGSVILLYDVAWYPSDPMYDRLGSLEVCGVFIDECGQLQYRAWATLITRIRYKLDEYGITPKILGSLNPTKAWPYYEFYVPWKKGTEAASRKFIQALVTDNPWAPQVYIQNLRQLKDKAQRERLLHGNWEYDDDPTALFNIEAIADMFTNTAKRGMKYISADASRRGRDNMVVCVWDGLQCIRAVEIPLQIRSDTSKSAAFILSLAESHGVRRSNIIVDEDGVGSGIVDQIPGCKGFVNGSSAVLTEQEKSDEKEKGKKVNYAHLKAQCYFLLSQYAEQGKIGLTLDPDQKETVTQELEQMKQWNADKDGKVSVTPKEKVKEAIGRSPDYADAVMMRMRFELPFETKKTYLGTPLIAGVSGGWAG